MIRRRATRRDFLQLSGAAVAGGLAEIMTAGRAPAYAQQTAIHWSRWNDFVPASDQLLRNKIAPEAAKALGVKLNIETINANDIQACITSAVQSGTGPDIICALNNWPQLYADSVVDVSDIANEIGTAQGGFFADAGYADGEAPDTWESYIAAGTKMKAGGRPFGQTLGHTFGDAPAFWYPYLWSWGGKEVEADGKTGVLNSPATVDSVKFAVSAWKDAYDEGGLAWDDSSNNRAFLSGTVASTLNGASIYLEAKRKPDSYQTADDKPLKNDIFHSVLPKGPAGQFSYHIPFSNVLMGYSKNQKAGKDFLRWIGSPQIYALWFESQQGFSVGATTDWEKSRVWEDDPVMGPYRLAARSGRFAGYAGPSWRSAAEAVTKYIIVDMYAKAVQGMAPANSVTWVHEQLVKIYA